MLLGQVRPKRRALGVRSVAAGAGRAVLTVEDLLAERDLLLGLSRGRWKIAGGFCPRVGMDTFGRLCLAASGSSGLILGGGRRGRLDSRCFYINLEGHTPDTTLLGIPDIKPYRQSPR